MIEVVDRGLMVSTKKVKGRGRKKVEKKKPGEDLNLDINGENTLGMDSGTRNLKLKLCSTPA